MRAEDIKARAARFGRSVKVCMHPYVICRETEREVNEVRDYIIRNADQETLEQEYHFAAPRLRPAAQFATVEQVTSGANIGFVMACEQLPDHTLKAQVRNVTA